MLSCKEVSKLVSESLDGELSLWQRFNLWMHLSMCRLCWGFRKDLVHLHEQTQQHAHEIEDDVKDSDVRLPVESRDRMKRLLKSQS